MAGGIITDVKKQGNHNNGVQVGEWKIYERYSHLNNNNYPYELREIQHYDQNGNKHGKWELFATSHQINSGSTTYINGKRHGLSVKLSNEKVIYKAVFDQDVLRADIAYVYDLELKRNVIVASTYNNNTVHRTVKDEKTKEELSKTSYKIERRKKEQPSLLTKIKENLASIFSR